MPEYEGIAKQLYEVSLAIGAHAYDLNGIQIEVVRISHVGWPKVAEVENLVHRVTMDNIPKPLEDAVSELS